MTHQQASEESQPSWSPDGKTIAFIADHQVAVGEAIPGTPYKRISESNATRGAHIDWSRDGKTLAFKVSHSHAHSGSEHTPPVAFRFELTGDGKLRALGPEGKSIELTKDTPF